MDASLLTMTRDGLYCPAGDFHIDPMRPAARAIVTHGHADHARPGHGRVLATPATLDIMRIRYGASFAASHQALPYGEALRIGDVNVSLHPAGHVLGSAQVLLERRGEKALASGDYKRTGDPTCAPFEPIRCHLFVSEATFGLPVFRHPSPEQEITKLIDSLRLFPERTHLVGAYALGKAQRVIALLRQQNWDRPIFIHGAIEKLAALYERHGVRLGELRMVSERDRKALAGEIVVCPPGALNGPWSLKFPDPLAAVASGWMRIRARARQSGAELPLVISDHADWTELCATIRETHCEELWVTHGAEDALTYWAQTQGLRARALRAIGYGEAEDEATSGELA